MSKPDLNKVKAAVAAFELRRNPVLVAVNTAVKDRFRNLPVPPSPIAHDSAIRKPLKAVGVKCTGFDHRHFLHSHD